MEDVLMDGVEAINRDDADTPPLYVIELEKLRDAEEKMRKRFKADPNTPVTLEEYKSFFTKVDPLKMRAVNFAYEVGLYYCADYDNPMTAPACRSMIELLAEMQDKGILEECDRVAGYFDYEVAEQYIQDDNDLGNGVPEHDYEKAREYYQRAIDQGYYLGYIGMGNMYLKGLGVDKNEAYAFSYFTSAHLIDPTETEAVVNLSDMYAKGIGVAQNTKLAMELLERRRPTILEELVIDKDIILPDEPVINAYDQALRLYKRLIKGYLKSESSDDLQAAYYCARELEELLVRENHRLKRLIVKEYVVDLLDLIREVHKREFDHLTPVYVDEEK